MARFLAAENLGGVLLNAQHNFAWLTCGGRNGVDQSRDPGVGTLLIRRDGRRFVLASKIEMARLLAEELCGQDWEPIEFGWAEEKASSAFIAERAQALLETGGALGADLLVGGEARVVEGALTRLRYSLTEAELERYRALGCDVVVAIGEVACSLTPGLTVREIARRAADALAAYRASAVVALVVAARTAFAISPSGSDRAAVGKIVMIAVCARRGGLTASLSRIVCAGRVPDELLRRTEKPCASMPNCSPPPDRA